MFHTQVIHTVIESYQQAKFLWKLVFNRLTNKNRLSYYYYYLYIYNIINIINELSDRKEVRKNVKAI